MKIVKFQSEEGSFTESFTLKLEAVGDDMLEEENIQKLLKKYKKEDENVVDFYNKEDWMEFLRRNCICAEELEPDYQIYF